MTTALLPVPIFRAFTSGGIPLAGGLVYTYAANTTTPQTTYSDAAGTVPNANPVVLDSTGSASIRLDPTLVYKIVLKDSGGATQWTEDYVTGAYIYQSGDIRSFGAVVGVDCASIVTAAAAAVSNVIFPAGAWVISSTPTIPSGVVITTLPGATFSGAGAAALGLDTTATIVSNQITDFNPPVTGTLATLNIFRNPNYTGGPAGTNFGIRVQTNVGSGVTNFEWAIVGIVNNSAAVGAGQNVGVYGQGNKGTPGVRGGPTWGMVAEAHDKSGLADPTDGLVGLEVDATATGTDANGRRIGIDLVVGTDSGTVATVTYGIRIGPTGGSGANGLITNGLYLQGVHATGINIHTASGSAVGIDISSAVLSGPAIRLASAQLLSFKSDDTKTLRYSAANVGLTYAVGGTDEIILHDSGAISMNCVGTTTKWIGTQSTAAATATLTANKPGANGGVSFWLSVLIGGTQCWVPAFAN